MSSFIIVEYVWQIELPWAVPKSPILNRVKFRNMIFRQIRRISMGSNPAPFFTHLFFYCKERRWIRVRRFANVFRWLTVINGRGEFERSCKEIYPPDPELKKGNICSSQRSFLGLSVRIERGKSNIQLYNKRLPIKTFHKWFPIFSNYNALLRRMFYSSFGAEILQTACTTNECDSNRVVISLF